jgi:hypothetical protein
MRKILVLFNSADFAHCLVRAFLPTAETIDLRVTQSRIALSESLPDDRESVCELSPAATTQWPGK